jgi:Skp family chaperone for outer membrane proteins
MNMKLTILLAGIVLTLASFGTYAADEGHIAEALKHTKTAIQSPTGKEIAEHAEAAKTHTKESAEHLNAAITNLDAAIEHGKAGHDELAKKAAEEALTHLKAAQ